MDVKVSLSAPHILFLTELIAIGYIDTVAQKSQNGEISTSLTLQDMESSLAEVLRVLLQDALKDASFRKIFSDHFSQHPHANIREIAEPWMNQQLIWEI